jgi:hypothetical protein
MPDRPALLGLYPLLLLGSAHLGFVIASITDHNMTTEVIKD